MNKRNLKAAILSLLLSSCSLVSANGNIKGEQRLNTQGLNTQLLCAGRNPQMINYSPRMMQRPVNVNNEFKRSTSVGRTVAKTLLGVGLTTAVSLEVGTRIANGESFFGNLLKTGDDNEASSVNEGYVLESYNYPLVNEFNNYYGNSYGSSEPVNEMSGFDYNSQNFNLNESNNGGSVNSKSESSVEKDGNGKVIDGQYYYSNEFLRSKTNYPLANAITKKISDSIYNAWKIKYEEEYQYSMISGYSFSKSWEKFSSEWKYGDENSVGDFDFRIYFKPFNNSDEERVLYDSLDSTSWEEQKLEALNKDIIKSKPNNSENNSNNLSLSELTTPFSGSTCNLSGAPVFEGVGTFDGTCHDFPCPAGPFNLSSSNCFGDDENENIVLN